MDSHPYQHYLFFKLNPRFYELSDVEQKERKEDFSLKVSGAASDALQFETYATAGFKPDSEFMIWCRAQKPEPVQQLLHVLYHTRLGSYLSLSRTYFGIVRDSEYSGRAGKPEQMISTYPDHLSYLIIYPFTKTTEWHALDFENRKSIMGQHVKVGLSHPAIRQCLLYSYGVDDQEFLVSYETATLEEFQDLVIEMRRTIGRKYTLLDTPVFTCIRMPLPELMDLL